MRLLTLILSISFSALSGQSLPHNLTETERTQLDQIGIHRTITDPPEQIQYTPAEFDSLAGILFPWESYTTLMRQLIKEVAEEDTAWIIVDGASQQTTVTNTLSGDGVNMDNIAFIYESLNSVWMRDYGPWWIYDEAGNRAILDLVYNRPRPLDDGFPEDLAEYWNLDYYGLDLTQAGGNMLLDGKGAVILTDIIFDDSEGFDSTLTQAELEELMLDYFGVHKVIVVPHMEDDGTGHVDMFVKLLNDTTVLVGEYESASDAAGNNYAITDSVAAQLANETNGAGHPFNVVRMLMPPYSGGVTYTYINSLIVNKKILVPVYGFSTDQEILDQYEDLMPGYEAVGFDCNDIITANGAIHCIAMKVPASGVFGSICSDWLTGDVNSDGKLSIYDVLAVSDMYISGESGGYCMDQAADFSGDSELSLYDIGLLVTAIINP